MRYTFSLIFAMEGDSLQEAEERARAWIAAEGAKAQLIVNEDDPRRQDGGAPAAVLAVIQQLEGNKINSRHRIQLSAHRGRIVMDFYRRTGGDNEIHEVITDLLHYSQTPAARELYGGSPDSIVYTAMRHWEDEAGGTQE
jgi:hypothetical protein